MAGREDLASDPESDTDGKFVREELAQAAKWDAKSVSIDERMLEGRRANRGFTIAMGKTADAGDELSGVRREKRAQTLPSFGSRRGDYALSEEALKLLMERSAQMSARLRRGSVVAHTVLPEEEIRGCFESQASLFVYGLMTEGQQAGDERERSWIGADKFPGDLPPVLSCTKGSKGFRDTTPNQDNFSVAYLKNGYHVACCMDGHGPFGHLVSSRAVQTVPYYLVNSPHFPDDMPKALEEAFSEAQREVVALSLEQRWDVQASGSTAVAAVWKGNTIWTANVGDSRCVVGYESSRKMSFETEDHKPNSPEEQKRIEQSGGEVRSQTYPDGWTVHRIFVKGQDFPGLCMTRTLGDESVKAHGVIATPEVRKTEVDLTAQPFVILASDGVWEFLDSEFVIKAVAKKIQTDGPERTVQKLQREARKRWRQEEGDYCDDITSILIQLR